MDKAVLKRWGFDKEAFDAKRKQEFDQKVEMIKEVHEALSPYPPALSRKVFIINAPPSSGKDTIANHMETLGFGHGRFKTRLIEITKAVYGMADTDVAFYSQQYVKDKPALFKHSMYMSDQARYFDVRQSYRDALIMVSEELIKPFFGKDYFGRALVSDIRGTNYAVTFVSDGGFKEEIGPLIEAFGKENVHLIQLHRTDVKGFEESGDSRRPLDPSMFGTFHELENDPETMTMQDLCLKAEKIVEDVLAEKTEEETDTMALLTKDGKETTAAYAQPVGTDMAQVIAQAQALKNAAGSFIEDVDLTEILSSAASSNGYYKDPLDVKLVNKAASSLLVIRFKDRRSVNNLGVISAEVNTRVDGTRSYTFKTFAKEGQNIVESISELTPTSIGEIQKVADDIMSSQKMSRVAPRTARRYRLALSTGANVLELS